MRGSKKKSGEAEGASLICSQNGMSDVRLGYQTSETVRTLVFHFLNITTCLSDC